MKFPLCRHVRTNGLQCKAPALTRGLHCFFHTRLYQRHSGFRPPAATVEQASPAQHIHLGPIEDAESVQLAFSEVINALAIGRLDPNLATKLLYGLQMASNNLARLPRHVPASEVVRSVEPAEEGYDLANQPAFYDDWQDDAAAE